MKLQILPSYETNFHKEKTGNSLHVGEDLTIRIGGNPLYVAGVLYKQKAFWRWQVIQIEQTGHRSNPSKEAITFEMKDRGGAMSPGNYRVKTKCNIGGQEFGWDDKFEIVQK